MRALKLASIVFLIMSSSVNGLSYGPSDNTSTTKDRELLLTLRNSNCLSSEQRLANIQNIVNPLLSEAPSQTKDNSGLTHLMIASALGDIDAVKEILKRHRIHTSSKVVYPEEAYDDFYDPDKNPPTLISKTGKELSEANVLLSENDSEQKAFSNIAWALKKPLIETDNTLIKERKPYTRAETIQGYTALSFAVVAGHHEIVKLLIAHTQRNLKDRIYRLMTYQIIDETERMDFAKRRSSCLTYDFINKTDKSGWTAINYAVSFNSECMNEAELEKRINIVEILIKLGVTNNVVTVWEGDLDILGLASKYGHYQLVHRILCLYLAKIQDSNILLRYFFGDYFRESIKNNITVLEKIIEGKEEKKTQDIELENYKKTLTVLRTWERILP